MEIDDAMDDESVPLRVRIVRVLRASSIPISTTDLIAIVAPEMTNARAQVWMALSKLQKHGIIASTMGRKYREERKTVEKPKGYPIRMWRMKNGVNYRLGQGVQSSGGAVQPAAHRG